MWNLLLHWNLLFQVSLYNLTANAEKFLQSVQNQVAELGVKIQYCVSQEGADEAR